MTEIPIFVITNHDLPSLIFGIIGFLVLQLVAFFVWALPQSQKTGRLLQKFDDICESVKQLTDKFPSFDMRLITVEAKLTQITDILVSKWGSEYDFLKSKSPLSLTEKSQKLLQSSGFITIFEENKNVWLKQIQTEHPQNETEIDQISEKIISSISEKELLDKLEVIAYENAIPLPVLLKICGVYLREYAIKTLLKK